MSAHPPSRRSAPAAFGLATLVALGALLAGAGAAGAQNLVVNPHFHDDDLDWEFGPGTDLVWAPTPDESDCDSSGSGVVISGGHRQRPLRRAQPVHRARRRDRDPRPAPPPRLRHADPAPRVLYRRELRRPPRSQRLGLLGRDAHRVVDRHARRRRSQQRRRRATDRHRDRPGTARAGGRRRPRDAVRADLPRRLRGQRARLAHPLPLDDPLIRRAAPPPTRFGVQFPEDPARRSPYALPVPPPEGGPSDEE